VCVLSELSEAGRGGLASIREHQTSDRVHVSQERKRLFENDVMDMDTFTNTLMGAAEEAQPVEISELILIMGKQQLASSLQHMVLKWKELKASMTAGTQPCRSSTSDSRLLRLATGTHPGATTTSPTVRRRLPNLPRTSGRGLSLLADRSTPEPKQDIPMRTPAHRSKNSDGNKETATSHDDKPRKPAAKLESYAGQGASVESFLDKLFESHAKYFRWSEQDKVFQLKNSLTRTTAQALWTGGQNTV